MARGTGTHFGSPLYGDDRSGGGLYEEVPVDIQSRTNRAAFFFDLADVNDMVTGTNWTKTDIVASSLSAVTTTNGGVFTIDPGAVDNQGLGSLQFNVAYMVPNGSTQLDGMPSRIISAEARFACSDFSASDWFWGLAAADTTLMGTTGALLTTGADNCVGWHHAGETLNQGGINQNDANDVRMVSAGGGVANMEATLLSLANVAPVAVPANSAIDAIQVSYGIKIIGTQNVEFYRNQRLVHRRRMSNALAASLTLSFTNVNVGGAGGQNVISLDYCWGSTSR